MSEDRHISDLSLLDFKENIPRLDQRVRVAAKAVVQLGKDAVDNGLDLIFPEDDQLPTENRLEYLHRRAEARHKALGDRIDSYVLEKGFGTEMARKTIERRRSFRVQDR